MGTIELFDGYYIECDDLNCTLKQRYKGNTRDGNSRDGVRVYGYYPSVKAALKRFSELIRVDSIAGKWISLTEYFDAIEKADKKVMEFLETLEVRYEDT